MIIPLEHMARPTSSSPLGKCDDRIDIPVPSQLKDHLAALAVASGYGSTGEYLRQVLVEHAYGRVAALQALYGRVRPTAMGAAGGSTSHGE